MMNRKRLSALPILVLFLTISKAAAQSDDARAVRQGSDELLVLVRAGDVQSLKRFAITQPRFYQRLGDYYIAGVDRTVSRQMEKARIPSVLVDERPWTGVYAAISAHPEAGARLAGIPLQILYTGNGLQLVKCSQQGRDALRERGVSYVEIERVEIPVEIASTYMPPAAGPIDTVQTIVNHVSDSAITSCIQGLQNFGTRMWNQANRDTVARWVQNRYSSFGIGDVVLDSFQYSGTWQQNVVATIPGTVNPAAEIIVGGHQDSYSSTPTQAPGADDNASGTAAALEMARVLKLMNYQPAYTLRFMGFAAEEAGLRGSASYAQRARAANRDIRVMMNYDMIGNRNQAQPDRDFYIVWYTGSEAFRDLHAATARMYTSLNPVATTSYRTGSDSYSFWQQNYNTVFCIERDFSPYYHSPSDLLQYLDIPYANEIIRAALAMLLTLDMMPSSVPGLTVRDRGNGSTLVVSWDSVAVADWYRYKVYLGEAPGTYDTSYVQTVRTRTIGGLTEGTTYYIGVSIIDLVGREGMITEKSSVPLSVPLPPAGITAAGTQAGIDVGWRGNLEMDLRGYNLYRSLNPLTGFVRLNDQPMPDTTCADTTVGSGLHYYYVAAVDSSGNESAGSDTVQGERLTGVRQIADTPLAFRLLQNHPNPFNPTTELRYDVGKSGRVTLRIYDVLGKEVARLVDEYQPAGRYSIRWDAQGLASGLYFCRLSAYDFSETRKLILLK